MKLYSERHGKRVPRKHTNFINENVYSLLLNCCVAYEKNLVRIFPMKCHNSFVDEDYTTFNKDLFLQRISILIPSLFRNKSGKIATPQPGDDYDQYALLDLIEFFGKNINDIHEKWNNERYRNYKYITSYNSSDIFNDFKTKINELFLEAGLLYKLTDKKIIERIVDYDVVTPEMENSFKSLKDKELRDLLKDAIDLYRTPNHLARQDSIEKLWDALERLKTYYAPMDKKTSIDEIVTDMSHGNSEFKEIFNDEFLFLTNIGNSFSIRHHETNQKQIIDTHYYDYLFKRCISLVALSIKYLKK